MGLAVHRPAREELAVDLGGREGIGVPAIFQLGGLDVVMAVDEDRRRVRPRAQPLAVHQGMAAFLAEQFDACQADAAHVGGDPLGRALDVPGALRQGADAGDGQQIGEFGAEADGMLAGVLQGGRHDRVILCGARIGYNRVASCQGPIVLRDGRLVQAFNGIRPELLDIGLGGTMTNQNEIHDSPTAWVAEHIQRYVELDGENGHEWKGATTLLLTTRGRKSGQWHRTALIYGQDGDRYILVASRGGHPHHPACTSTSRPTRRSRCRSTRTNSPPTPPRPALKKRPACGR